MKKLMCNLGAKITFIILSFVMAMIMFISGAGTVVMAYYDFYTNSKDNIKQDVFTDMAENEINEVHSLYQDDMDLDEYFSNKNIFYEIKDENGTILTNYNGTDYIAKATQDEFYKYFEVTQQSDDGSYYTQEVKDGQYSVTVYIPKDLKYSDRFALTDRAIHIGYNLKYWAIAFTVLSLVCTIVLISFLCCAVGHRKDHDDPVRNHLDYLPFDLFTIIIIALVFAGFVLLSQCSELVDAIIVAPIVGTVLYFSLLAYLLSFATRIKTHTFISNNLIVMIFRYIKKHGVKFFNLIGHIYKNLTLVKKTLMLVFGVLAIEFLVLVNCVYYPPEFIFFIFLFDAAIAIFSILLAISLQKIKNGGEEIAKGDLECKIDTKYMYGDFKDFSESLNNINEGLQNAVNEKMKSERFKTELITNVSHDIKTPLTSIINYVDLIKKQDPQDETIKQYVEVLDRQSNRLKKLIVDLVEASKASTGNLAVNFSKCEVGVLLAQTVGEFDERLKKSGIEPVLNNHADSVKIMADGRHLWRVFDNLMSNICKYAQPSTRAYLDVSEKDGKAIIEFKNVSKYQLNMSSDELMERFVRGDTSRNTEGSGLGLSIAKSLIELQNGSMQLTVDGDLFKVTLTFDSIK